MKGSKVYLILIGACTLLTSSFVSCVTASPARFTMEPLEITPAEIAVGQTTNVYAKIKNVGGVEDTYTMTLSIDGTVKQTKVISLGPGADMAVVFPLAIDKAGDYSIKINETTKSLHVRNPAIFSISGFKIDPLVAKIDQIINVSVKISNQGESEDYCTLTLKSDGKQIETKKTKIAPGGMETVSFSFSADSTGYHKVELGDQSGMILIVTDTENVLAHLNIIYPELYEELIKLPDLKDIDERENKALEQIAVLASNDKYRKTFDLILTEGIKNERKYCVPLEALLWLAYDDLLITNDTINYLENSRISELVSDAWNNTSSSRNYSSTRWQDFNTVVNRLNSPKMIVIYLRNNFTYSYSKGEAEGVKSAEQVFSEKKGACYDHALFAGYCLINNGYGTAKGMAVNFNRRAQGYFIGHIVCVYQEPKDSLYYTIDNAGGSSVYGPFMTIDDAAKASAVRGSFGEANLLRYSLHNIDTNTGHYKSVWLLY